MILRSLNCVDDTDFSNVKEIATMESKLQILSEQKVKYYAKYDESLKQYVS